MLETDHFHFILEQDTVKDQCVFGIMKKDLQLARLKNVVKKSNGNKKIALKRTAITDAETTLLSPNLSDIPLQRSTETVSTAFESMETFKEKMQQKIDTMPKKDQLWAQKLHSEWYKYAQKIERKLKTDLAVCTDAVKFLQFWRNLRYSLEQFGSLIEPDYRFFLLYKEEVDNAWDKEVKQRSETLFQIVQVLGIATQKSGESFDVSNEWKKLKALHIPESTPTIPVQDKIPALRQAENLNWTLTLLNNAGSNEDAQKVWRNNYKTWPETANVLYKKDKSLFLNLSLDECRIVEIMASSVSLEGRRAWAQRNDHQLEIVNYVYLKKSQTVIDNINTDFYNECDFILHVRSDHIRIKPILEWLKNQWTTENGYAGFSIETPISEKIKAFCSENNYMWSVASKPPRSQLINMNTCELTPPDNHYYLEMVNGGDKIRKSVIQILMSTFYANIESSHTSTQPA